MTNPVLPPSGSHAPATPGAPATAEAWAFCYRVLPGVSRTFALTIPVLERPLGDAVCVAYLLCRIADTIEDRNDLELEARRALYRRFAAMVAAPERALAEQQVGAFLAQWPVDATPAYQALVEGLAQVLAAYGSLPLPQRAAIDGCVQEMVGGMSAMTHPEPEDGTVWVCADLPELERYCHYVAGTVGLMLTRLFDDVLGGGFVSPARLEEGRRFGLGLQLTNIVKDQAADGARGTSFVPREWLGRRGGLLPGHLAALLRRTLEHLDVAQGYTLALPPQRSDLRLFCLWALWMAVGTVREVARRNSPAPKISRAEVAEIIAFTRAHATDDETLNRRYARLREQACGAVDMLVSTTGGAWPTA